MLKLPSVLKIDKYLSIIGREYMFLIRKKLRRKLGLRQKLDFLLKRRVFSLYSTTFA